MELREGTRVFTPGGEEVGRVNRFVLDPATNEVTHIVIQKGWLLPEDKVMPFDMIRSATDERVVLNEEIGDFDELPSFEETHFIRATDDRPDDRAPNPDLNSESAPAYYWYPSQSNIGYPGIVLGHSAWPSGEKKRNIPEDTVALKEGTDVVSADGEKVGNVERLFLDGDSSRVIQFLVSHGTLFKDRKLIPIDWVKSVEESAVYLTVPTKLLERLPAYEES